MSFDGQFGQGIGYKTNNYMMRAMIPHHLGRGNSMLFTSLSGGVTDHQSRGFFSIGGGYREYIPTQNRIWGASYWLGMDDGNRKTYYRNVVALESLSRYVDYRLTGSFILGKDEHTIFDGISGAPFFAGNNILFPTRRITENAYNIIDFETGGLLPILGRRGVSGYVAAYYAYSDDAPAGLGVRFRVASRIHDQVNVGMNYANDEVFGASTWVSVAFQIPSTRPGSIPQPWLSSDRIIRGQNGGTDNFGRGGGGGGWLRPWSVRRRMAERVQIPDRISVKVRTHFSQETALNPDDSLPIFVTHVDPNALGGGIGTFESPFRALESARVPNPTNVDIVRIIPRSDDTGTNLAMLGPFVLHDSQRVLGTSFEHTFDATRGTFSLPGYTGEGPGPLIMNLANTDSFDQGVFRLASMNEISGLRIDGFNGDVDAPDFGFGIMTPAGIAITDFDINRNEFTRYHTAIRLTDATGTGLIDSNAIVGLVEPNPLLPEISIQGIHTDNTSVDPLDISLTFNTISGNSENGVLIEIDDSEVNLVATDNIIGGNGGDGISVVMASSSDILLLRNTFGVSPETGFVSNSGFGFHLTASSGDANVVIGGLEDLDGDGIDEFDLGNVFVGNLAGAIAFDLSGDVEVDALIQRNLIGIPSALDDSVIRSGFDEFTLVANDDLSTEETVPIGFDINFFGEMFSELFVNNNGNVTFDDPLGTYTPFPIVNNGIPMIAAFFADVDTRLGPEVTYGNDTVGGRPAFGVNYVDVRHFTVFGANAGLPTNSFQLVLIDRSDLAPGDFDIEFNYDEIVWEAGEASGSDEFGLGGESARVGYTNGVDTSFELAGSGVNGSFLDEGPGGDPPTTSLVNNSLNSGILGRYIFAARNGDVFGSLAASTQDGIRATLSDTASFVPSSLEILDNIITNQARHGVNVEVSDTAMVADVSIRRNLITQNDGNAVNMHAMDGGTINGRISENNLVDNLGQAIALRANEAGTLNFGSIPDEWYIRDNTILGNDAGGILIDAVGTLDIAGPAIVIDAIIQRNMIGSEENPNTGPGVFAQADGYHTTLGLTVGGEGILGNIVESAVDVGIGVVLRSHAVGQIAILDNVVTATIAGSMPEFDGDGIALRREGSSLITGFPDQLDQVTGLPAALVYNNTSTKNAGNGFDLFAFGEDPTDPNQPFSGRPNIVNLDENIFNENMLNGADIFLSGEAVVMVNARQNLMADNTLNGLSISANGNSAFGIPATFFPPVTHSRWDGNVFRDNMQDGIALSADGLIYNSTVDDPEFGSNPHNPPPGGSYLQLDIRSDSADTLIVGNDSDGISLISERGGTPDVLIQGDTILAGPDFSTIIARNGTLADIGDPEDPEDDVPAMGHGIHWINTSIGNRVATPSNFFGDPQLTVVGPRTFIGGDTEGDGNVDDGIHLRTTFGFPRLNVGFSPFTGMDEGGVVIAANGGDGIEVDGTGSPDPTDPDSTGILASSPNSPVIVVANSRIGNLNSNLANGGDGIKINHQGHEGELNVSSFSLAVRDTSILGNAGRGLDMRFSGQLDPVNIALNRNRFELNGQEGIFLEIDPGLDATNVSVTIPGDPDPLADPEGPPTFGDMGIDPNHPALLAYPGYRWPYLSIESDLVVDVVALDNIIQNNGLGLGTERDLSLYDLVDGTSVFGGTDMVDGDGVFIRVGTNSTVNWDHRRNTHGGNLLSDFRVESFLSLALDDNGDPIVPLESIDNDNPESDIIFLDPAAVMNLTFDENTGDDLDVDGIPFAVFTNDDPGKAGGPFPTFRRAEVFDVNLLFNPDTNVFLEQGITLDVRGRFIMTGWTVAP
jgi:hypothetical protein